MNLALLRSYRANSVKQDWLFLNLALKSIIAPTADLSATAGLPDYFLIHIIPPIASVKSRAERFNPPAPGAGFIYQTPLSTR